MPGFETFCDTNFCGWAKKKRISIHLDWKFMKHFTKILKLANNKINECNFIDEKRMHIKVPLHIITYHLHYSHRKRFQRHCRLNPGRSPLLALCNKCHGRSSLLSLTLGDSRKETFSILAICTEIFLVLFKTYKTPLDPLPGMNPTLTNCWYLPSIFGDLVSPLTL